MCVARVDLHTRACMLALSPVRLWTPVRTTNPCIGIHGMCASKWAETTQWNFDFARKHLRRAGHPWLELPFLEWVRHPKQSTSRLWLNSGLSAVSRSLHALTYVSLNRKTATTLTDEAESDCARTSCRRPLVRDHVFVRCTRGPSDAVARCG